MLRGWTGWLVDRWDAIRGSYWFVPALLTAASAVVALGLVELDRRVGERWAAGLPWLQDVSAPAARAVLSTIAGSMMTVTGVVFSITIVALTLASSQFGPRLLRTFLRDRGSQLVLGTFLATFVFGLLVLRAVEGTERVPMLAAAAAVVLAVTSLFVLIYFVHHAASSIQASSVIAAVAAEIDEQLPQLFPERIGREPDPAEAFSDVDRERLERVDRDGDPIRAGRDGYLRVVDDEALLCVARERDLLLRVRARPGDFVREGEVVARALPGAHAGDADRRALCGAFRLGDQRTPVQDLAFLIDQLSEMAVRALSPGINDPKTAIACLHRLGALLARLADRRMPSGQRVDGDGRLRVVADPTRFEAVVASCFDAIRHHGARNPDVAAALLDAVAAGGANAAIDERRRALEEHAREVHEAFARAGVDSKRDRERVERALDRALTRLAAPTGAEG